MFFVFSGQVKVVRAMYKYEAQHVSYSYFLIKNYLSRYLFLIFNNIYTNNVNAFAVSVRYVGLSDKFSKNCLSPVKNSKLKKKIL